MKSSSRFSISNWTLLANIIFESAKISLIIPILDSKNLALQTNFIFPLFFIKLQIHFAAIANVADEKKPHILL